jgi:hypothetical protein
MEPHIVEEDSMDTGTHVETGFRTAKRWSVEVFIGEHDGKTRAEARLHTDDPTDLIGIGTSRLNPSDKDIPEIGDELAVARALSELAHLLLHAAVEDIAGVTQERVELTR